LRKTDKLPLPISNRTSRPDFSGLELGPKPAWVKVGVGVGVMVGGRIKFRVKKFINRTMKPNDQLVTIALTFLIN